jgi:hypothetical protein
MAYHVLFLFPVWIMKETISQNVPPTRNGRTIKARVKLCRDRRTNVRRQKNRIAAITPLTVAHNSNERQYATKM